MYEHIARRGHFLLESGLHADTWLELDALFARPAALADAIAGLTEQVRALDVHGVCGPLTGGAFVAQAVAGPLGLECYWTARVRAPATGRLYAAEYRLPDALRGAVGGKRIAIVDDAVSAASAAVATLNELTALGAHVVGVAALLQLGPTGAARLAESGLELHAQVRADLRSWPPAECPLCQADAPLDTPSSHHR